jgi:hypothetical protein
VRSAHNFGSTIAGVRGQDCPTASGASILQAACRHLRAHIAAVTATGRALLTLAIQVAGRAKFAGLAMRASRAATCQFGALPDTLDWYDGSLGCMSAIAMMAHVTGTCCRRGDTWMSEA